MPDIAEYVWDFVSGRDGDGDRYRVHRLIDGSGRILAKVCEPDGGYYDHRVYFFLEKELDGEDFRFIDIDSAKRFAVAKLAERSEKRAAGEPVAAAAERETAEAKP